MKTALMILMFTLGLNAFATTVITTSPEVATVSIPGSLSGTSTSFISMGDGTFGIVVALNSVHYQSGDRNYNGYFRPTEGVIKKVGNTLVYTLDGVDTIIARKNAWYSPWKKSPGVKIDFRVERSGSRLGWDLYDVSANLEIQ